MNQSYFQLPLDKQKNLINAGYKVFATYPYKKASMLAISEEAGISKSLLFYYFRNKEEYYLYLFDTA
ncbi:MAG: helix-turn-helix domain-containing protein, partial [Bacillota bacterium]|nr:helix-turn-helix domain-containing protein [Bacillota bacterium]